MPHRTTALLEPVVPVTWDLHRHRDGYALTVHTPDLHVVLLRPTPWEHEHVAGVVRAYESGDHQLVHAVTAGPSPLARVWDAATATVARAVLALIVRPTH